MNIHDVISTLIDESKDALEIAKGLPQSCQKSYGFGYQMGQVDAFNAALKLIMESDAGMKDLVVGRFMEHSGAWAGVDVEDGSLAFGFTPPEGHYERDGCPELYEFIAKAQEAENATA